MNEVQGMAKESFANLTIFNVDEEDGQEFAKIMRKYRGNTGRAAFKEMLSRYKMMEIIGTLVERINELEDRIKDIESSPEDTSIKTFGGHKIGGKV